MNFHQWYVFHFVQWPFAIFWWLHDSTLTEFLLFIDKKLIPVRFQSFIIIESFIIQEVLQKMGINSNLMVQGQGHMVDVTSLSNQALIFFGE